MKAVRAVKANSYAAFQPEIDAFLDANRQSEVLVIAASRGAADDMVWRNGGIGLIGVHRFTLTQVAALFAAGHLAEKKRKIATAFVSEAIAARVAYELTEKQSWSYFAEVASMPGFPKALANTLAELRFNSIKASDLEKIPVVGEDLSGALDEYGRQLETNSIADLSEIYEVANTVVRGGHHRLSDLPIILLDTPIKSEHAAALIAQLLATSPRALICALSTDKQSQQMIESILREPAESLGEIEPEKTLARIRSSLFELQSPEEYSPDASLDYFSGPGETMECVEIARRIIKTADKGTAFDQIAVLLRSPEQYEPLLEEAFRRAAVPAYFSRGVVRPDPAGRAFLALLLCAMEGCSASRFAEYLSLSQVPSPDDRIVDPVVMGDEVHIGLRPDEQDESAEGNDEKAESDAADDTSAIIRGTLQAPTHWEHLIVEASVVGGAERWERRLNAMAAEFQLKIERNNGYEGERSYFEAELARLENLKTFALPLISALHALPASAPWGDWLAALGLIAEMSLRTPGGVLSILEELSPMSDIGSVSLQEVLLVLSDRLRFLRREPSVRRHGRVFVGSIDEARGRMFDFVFVPGLAEGLFPRRVVEDPLLLDAYRQQGKLAGRIITNSERVENERLLLRIGLASATKQFTFSFPRIDVAQSRPRVPSLYALETIRAAYGHLPELRWFQEHAADRAASRLDRLAPPTFDDAIDDTEYDLVALDHAIHKPGKAGKTGAMAYLTQVSKPLARSLRARYSQWEVRKWTAADGLIIPEPELKSILQSYRLSARPYSATALQAFAACPYRFGLMGLQGLRPRTTIQPLTQMDALTRGSLFHDVQREFFMRSREQQLLPLSSTTLDGCQAVLDGALIDIERHYRERLAPAIGRIWRAEIEDIRTDLDSWLREIAKQNEWMPEHFELAFGLRNADDHEQPVTLKNGLLLRGSIDLVERHVTRGALRVVDHKTGKALDRPFVVLGGGTALQPMLYGLAAEKLLSAQVETGSLFYCTQRGGYRKLEVPLSGESRLRVDRALEIIDGAISSGMLPAAPNRDACRFCDCSAACGPHEELRWKRKPALDDLAELRNMP